MLEREMDHEVEGDTTAEVELLIHCLRGSPFQLSQETDWHALLSLAEKHGVLPLIENTLAAHEAEVPDFFLNAVQQRRDATAMLAAELEHLLARFAERNIDVLPLKGPVLGEALYGDITMRPSVDLDLLVRRADLDRAENLLMNAGWVTSGRPDEYHHKFTGNGILLELHFGIVSPRAFPFDLEGAWARATRSTFCGQPIVVMADGDRALYLCLHGLKHGFAKLLWVADAAHALASVHELEPRELVARARAHGLEQVLHISCVMVLEVFPQHLPQGLVAVMAESPELEEKARACVDSLLAGGAGGEHEPEIWSFYLQAETDACVRWRRRLNFFVRTVEDDKWAEQHRIPRHFMLFLRPLRLLGKYGIRRAWRSVFPSSAK